MTSIECQLPRIAEMYKTAAASLKTAQGLASRWSDSLLRNQPRIDAIAQRCADSYHRGVAQVLEANSALKSALDAAPSSFTASAASYRSGALQATESVRQLEARVFTSDVVHALGTWGPTNEYRTAVAQLDNLAGLLHTKTHVPNVFDAPVKVKLPG